jgi:hypothetical protein
MEEMFAMAMDASGDRTRAPESPRSRARLGADRNDVRTDHRPLSDARDVRLSHPSPATPACGGSRGSGAGPGVRAYRASQRSNPYLRPHVLSTLEPADVSARGPPVWIPAPRLRPRLRGGRLGQALRGNDTHPCGRSGADRRDVCTDHGPLSDALDVRLSHPSPVRV